MPGPKLYYPVYSVRLGVRLEGGDAELDVMTEMDDPKKKYEELLESEWLFKQHILPLRFNLERNDFFEADALGLSFDFMHVPIDPRIIRAIRVELFGAMADPAAYGKALKSGKSFVSAPMDDDHRMFVGYADDVEINLLEGRDTLELECRDYQGILMDKDIHPRLLVSLRGDMLAGELAGLLIGAYPSLSGIKIDSVGDAADKRIPKATGGKRSKKETVWQYLVRRLLNGGVIPYMFQETLYLVKIGDAFSQREFGWRARNWKGAKERPVFVAGHDLTKLRIRRKLSRKVAPPIEIRSYDPAKGKVVRKVYPPEAWRKLHPEGASVSAADSMPRVVEVPFRPSNEFSNLMLAKDLFHLHSRNELGLEFTTRDLTSYGVREDQGDILRLYAGDPVSVVNKMKAPDKDVGKGHLNDTLAKLNSMSREELVKHLINTGYAGGVAQTLAKSLKEGLPTTYKMRKMIIDYSADNGTMVNVEAAEYMTGAMDPNWLDIHPEDSDTRTTA